MKWIVLPLLFFVCWNSSLAQELRADKASFVGLNQSRIHTNQKGMVVLGSWASVNILVGTAGYFIADYPEWKAFHGMNAIWNVVNGVIAVGGYYGAKKEMAASLSCNDMLHRYESNKRLYLVNAGLDVLYLGTGAFLIEHSKNEANPDTWKGLGESIALQGAFLLFFDSIMYASHQCRDKKWYKAVNGICFTGNGFKINLGSR
jgi:hypothetical protein